jgi:hypothetical protein
MIICGPLFLETSMMGYRKTPFMVWLCRDAVDGGGGGSGRGPPPLLLLRHGDGLERLVFCTAIRVEKKAKQILQGLNSNFSRPKKKQ